MSNNISEIRFYAEYNVWANEEISKVISALSDKQFNSDLPGSFKGIQPTLLHIADAQHIWLERLLGNSLSAWPSKDFNGNRSDVMTLFSGTGSALQAWVLGQNENTFSEEFSFKSLDGTEYSTPISITLMHVFNHSSYHRGQLVNFLRSLGITEIPSTDLIRYYRVVR